MMYENLMVKWINFIVFIVSVFVILRVQIYIFIEVGNIIVGGEIIKVEKGIVKFNIILDGWIFCIMSICNKGGLGEVGVFVDFIILIKGKGMLSCKIGNNKCMDGEEYDFGGEVFVVLFKKVSV